MRETSSLRYRQLIQRGLSALPAIEIHSAELRLREDHSSESHVEGSNNLHVVSSTGGPGPVPGPMEVDQLLDPPSPETQGTSRYLRDHQSSACVLCNLPPESPTPLPSLPPENGSGCHTPSRQVVRSSKKTWRTASSYVLDLQYEQKQHELPSLIVPPLKIAHEEKVIAIAPRVTLQVRNRQLP